MNIPACRSKNHCRTSLSTRRVAADGGPTPRGCSKFETAIPTVERASLASRTFAGHTTRWTTAALCCVSIALTGIAAPSLVSTGSLDGRTIGLCFDTALDPVSSQATSTYTVPGATVAAASLLSDQRTVLLAVEGLTGTSYTVNGTGLKDDQGVAGSISGTGTVTGLYPEDIGNLPDASLAYACSAEAISVRVSGGAIWFSADSGNLVHQEKTGDFDVRVQVSKVAGGTPNSNMILMMRETADPGSRHVAVTVYPTQRNWTSFRRVETDGASSVLAGNWRIDWPAGVDFPNAWLRLRRAGNTFTTYGSTDGLDWVQVGDAYAPDPPFPASARLGLATAVTDGGAPPLEVEYRNFGVFELSNASISITNQPHDLTVTENLPATFSIGATVVNGPQSALAFQWQRNGVDIEGAIGASYSLALTSMADGGARFRVKVAAPGLTPVFSEEATLTVQKDVEPPSIVSTAGLKGTTIGVCFDELLDAGTAIDPARYTLSGGTPVSAVVLLEDQRTVVLQVPGLTGASYSLTVTGVTDLAGNPANATANGEVLNYVVEDVGNLIEPSIVYTCSPEVINARVNGGAIWFSADSGNLLHQEQQGDFDQRVQISAVSGGTPNSNMILMARETTDSGSRHVAITVYPTQKNWTSFRRMETDGASSVLAGNWRITWPAGVDFPNAWLRLKRSGETFTTYGSTNGLDWIQVGDPYTPEPPFPASIRLGLATGVTDAGAAPLWVEYRNFGKFEVANATILIAAQPLPQSVVENRPATFGVGAVLQNGPRGALSYQWQRNSVDIPGAASATYTINQAALADSGARFRVRVSAPGATTVFSDDALLTVTGDLAGPTAVGTHAFGPGLVTICFDEALDPGSANDAARYSLGATVTVDSAELQADSQTVLLSVTGLAAAQYTVTVTELLDLKGNPGTSSAQGTLDDLTFLDIGDVTEPGVVTGCEPGAMTVRAGGADIWGFSDSFNLLYQPLTNDFDVNVRMTGIAGGNASTRGGLMAREDETPGSRNVFAGTYSSTGDNHWVATARANTDGNTSIIPGAYVVREANFGYPDAWLRLKRAGQTFSAFYSNNGLEWVKLGDDVVADPAYPDTILVGIASSSIFNAGAMPSAFFTYEDYGSTPAVIPPPELRIQHDQQTVVISWPADRPGFRLEQTTSLGASVSWAVVATTPEVVGERRQVTEPIAAEAHFYRLAR